MCAARRARLSVTLTELCAVVAVEWQHVARVQYQVLRRVWAARSSSADSEGSDAATVAATIHGAHRAKCIHFQIACRRRLDSRAGIPRCFRLAGTTLWLAL